MKVCKFGGSSLADAERIKRVIDIVNSDPERRYVVVSAPGKRYPSDRKMTDLLYEWHRLNSLQLSSEEIRGIIAKIFGDIVEDLSVDINISKELDQIAHDITFGATQDYAASRGEYLNGKIIAKALCFEFIDPMYCIRFDEQGRYDALKGYVDIRQALRGKRAVIPGFYGSTPKGNVKTFSRGGSDVTGAIIARTMGADLYENWTDVSGLLMADPRIVTNPHAIRAVTYRELRELAYMGANVFHEEAMFPVQEAGIVTNIRNTWDPENPGTLIISEDAQRPEPNEIIGIAGKRNFTVITVEKRLMNQEVGFARKALQVLESNGVSFEHMPSGIDTLSIIASDSQLEGKLDAVISGIKQECVPDTIEAYPGMAMIATVGRPMIHTQGVAAKLFAAVAKSGINIRMINQGSSELSIIIGVENDDYEDAIRAIYKAFTK